MDIGAVSDMEGGHLKKRAWRHGDRGRHLARTRTEVEEEAADVAILLFEFAAVCGIDLGAAIERKLARNAERYPVALAKGRAVKHDRLREG